MASLLSPKNPMRNMTSTEIAKARSSGVSIDKFRNPDYTGGLKVTGPGSGGSSQSDPGDYFDFAGLGTGSAGSTQVTIPFGTQLPDSMTDLKDYLQDIAQQNNAWSASQAQKQMDFQKQSAQDAMKFNHDEAELSRKWQEYMSNTAHQRQVKDLQAAGLNPVLAAQGGAPVTSGATASGYASQGAMGETDHSTGSALVSLLGSMIAAQTSLANTALSARTQEAVADKYTSMEQLVAKMQQDTSYGVAAIQRGTTLDAANISAMSNQIVAKIHAGATISSAQISAEASKVSASIHAAAQKYGYNLNMMTQRQLAAFNADLQRELKSKGLDYDLQLQNNSRDNELILRNSNPTSWAGLLTAGDWITSLAEGIIDHATSSTRAYPSSTTKSSGRSVGGFSGK